MDNKRINDFLEEIVLGKFLVNFLPGLILFFALRNFMDIRVGDGLVALIVVLSVSWILGVLVEMIFFGKSFQEKGNGTVFPRIRNIYLLFGKMGICIAAACLLCIDSNWDAERNYEDQISVLKVVFFGVAGILLYFIYWKQHRKMQ